MYVCVYSQKAVTCNAHKIFCSLPQLINNQTDDDKLANSKGWFVSAQDTKQQGRGPKGIQQVELKGTLVQIVDNKQAYSSATWRQYKKANKSVRTKARSGSQTQATGRNGWTVTTVYKQWQCGKREWESGQYTGCTLGLNEGARVRWGGSGDWQRAGKSEDILWTREEWQGLESFLKSGPGGSERIWKCGWTQVCPIFEGKKCLCTSTFQAFYMFPKQI